MVWNPRGSVWHRWDPHLHAPGTLLNDQFGGDWEAYLRAVENSSPAVEALGVTDYFCIQTYRTARAYKAQGRLKNIGLLFPNVEMRLDIKTSKSKPVNLHLLFSPDDPNHENEIENLLARLTFDFDGRPYGCSIPQLTELGRRFDPNCQDAREALRTGANQFKTSFQDIRRLFQHDKWLRENCLVAVAGGSNDGTAGLQDDSSFAAIRREIERFAHIIFASTPKQREFWLGKTIAADSQAIEKTYGSMKPCLHGSDAHQEESVAVPSLERYCWLRGDLAFEGLRQAVIEPEQRVWIGPNPPIGPIPSETVQAVTLSQAPWLTTPTVELNDGLVTIIGARGSGKTALMDFLAAGADALSGNLSESSFVQRASTPRDLLGDATVELSWCVGELTPVAVRDAVQKTGDRTASRVRYLSQQFVERLCSSAGLATELRREMEGVIFNATEQVDRLESDSFDALAATLLQPVYDRRGEFRASIQNIGAIIVQAETSRDELPALQKKIEGLSCQIDVLRKELASLLPKDKEVHAKRLSELELAHMAIEGKVEGLRRRRRLMDDLGNDVRQTQLYREPERYEDLKRRFVGTGLLPQEWDAFHMNFVGNPEIVLSKATRELDRMISVVTVGDPSQPVDLTKTPLTGWPLTSLHNERETVKKNVGIDAIQQKKYDELLRTITQQEALLRRLQVELENSKGAADRRNAAIARRREEYTEAFRTFESEQEILKKLYLPLSKTLSDAQGALAKLTFIVRRQVDIEKWVTAGEGLIDLRRASRFQGYGALLTHAREHLLDAWTSGGSDVVDKAMDAFRNEFQEEFLKARADIQDASERRSWGQSVASWLYDTSHIAVEYGITYDGTPIERLSPGTRGIVLLLLYLAIDTHDRRPLLIDQPEENLDPQSVFEELVPHFRAARQRRQIIIVTHNANLVVNTDADQVIVATSRPTAGGGLPTITYESGSLENPDIRGAVCQLLEGGRRAFLERAKRYRFYWDGLESADSSST